MTIGIIGAMEEEIRVLLDDMNVVTTRNVLGLDFYLGTISGSSNSVVLVRSGIGKVNSALCAQVLIDLFAVDAVINVGVAGAIAKEVKIGDIVISNDALYHDFDTSALGDEVGVISRMETSVFQADDELMAVAEKAVAALGTQAFLGRIASGDQFVSDPAVKERIATLFNPICCEMEGASIAHACYLNKVPFVIIRVISDNADEGSDINYEAFFRESAVTAGKVIKNMLAEI